VREAAAEIAEQEIAPREQPHGQSYRDPPATPHARSSAGPVPPPPPPPGGWARATASDNRSARRDRGAPPPPPPPSSSRGAPPTASPYAVLCVAEGAPVEICEFAFRALARKHHPDRGGDAEAWRRIRSALEEIKQRA